MVPVTIVAGIARRLDGRSRPRYRGVAGKEHARHFARHADAQLWLDPVATSVHTGAYVDPKRMRLTRANGQPSGWRRRST